MDIVETFIRSGRLTREGYAELLAASRNREAAKSLQREAVRLQKATYGNRVYVRGLIEFTNICKNGCYYCGINRENHQVERYRLTAEEVAESEPFDLLELIGRRRGMLLSGGLVNTERAAIMVVDEFRGGLWGRITLEPCPEKEDRL